MQAKDKLLPAFAQVPKFLEIKIFKSKEENWKREKSRISFY